MVTSRVPRSSPSRATRRSCWRRRSRPSPCPRPTRVLPLGGSTEIHGLRPRAGGHAGAERDDRPVHDDPRDGESRRRRRRETALATTMFSSSASGTAEVRASSGAATGRNGNARDQRRHHSSWLRGGGDRRRHRERHAVERAADRRHHQHRSRSPSTPTAIESSGYPSRSVRRPARSQPARLLPMRTAMLAFSSRPTPQRR